MLATLSFLFIIFETTKLVFIEKYQAYYSSVINFKKSKNRVFLVVEFLYIFFLLLLLFTPYWAVGLLIFLLSILIPKDDEITCSGIAIGSGLTILLLSLVVIM